jgi:hypothetical protein
MVGQSIFCLIFTVRLKVHMWIIDKVLEWMVNLVIYTGLSEWRKSYKPILSQWL